MRFATLILAFAFVASPSLAQATFVVDTPTDANDATPGDGVCLATGGGCTLRAAITEANALAGNDVIQLPSGTFALTLSGTNEDQNASGDLDIRSNVSIEGDSLGSTVITAAGLTSQRVLDVPVISTVNLSHLTLTGATLTGTTSTSAGAGLRVMAGSVVTLTACTVTGNATAHEGGAIYATGAGTTVHVLRSTISNNSTTGTTGFGGGLRTAVGASFTVVESTVSGNSSTAAGGGLNHGTSTGTVLIDRSLFVGNTAVSMNTGGGAISWGGPGRIVNSTFTNNTVTHPTPGVNQGGGAFWVSPLAAGVIVDVEASTIASNSAVHTGGGIRRQGSTGTLNIRASIIADNVLVSDTATARRDLFGNVNLAGYTLIEDSTGFNATETTDPGTNVMGVDPMLDVLADNGGPTLTRALLVGSPAINVGTCTLMSGGALEVDQRNVARVAPCDIGAFEYGVVVSTGGEPSRGGLTLSAPTPNPSRGAMTMLVTSDASRMVTVSMHDAIGRRVAVLFDGTVSPGASVPIAVAGGLTPGVYIVRAVSGESVTTRRLVVAR